jgi:hypothetical protein
MGRRSGTLRGCIPARVQSPFSALTALTFWAKSLRVCNCLWEPGPQSGRQIAHKTGFSKRSVHRLQQAIARRGRHPESWVWETEDGRGWWTRLVVATLSTFGLKRGGGGRPSAHFLFGCALSHRGEVRLRRDAVGCRR